MPETKVMVEMDLTENGIVSDSTPINTNNSTFADISKINNEHTAYSPFMTLEHNICILDGSLDIFDSENLDLSYFSRTLSDDNCMANDKITINFSSSHSIAGVGFDFGTDSFPDKVTLTFLYENKILDANDLKNTTVLGLLPICSHKEAIQNVAFTANACIDDTRDGIIKIYRQNQDIRFTLEPKYSLIM